LFTEEYVTETC